MTVRKVLYFAYATNLLKERMQVSMHDEFEFKCNAKLSCYKLIFPAKCECSVWKGNKANIVPSDSSDDYVMGCLWIISQDDLKRLEEHEALGHSDSIYKPINVTVHSTSGEPLDCVTFSAVSASTNDGKPSPSYLNVTINGAKQCNMPQDYIDRLRSIKHNDYNGQDIQVPGLDNKFFRQ